MIHLLPLVSFFVVLTVKQEWAILRKYLNNKDEEEEEIKLFLSSKKQHRREKYKYNRLNLEEHFAMCLHSNGFQRRYHMTYPSFKRLVKILDIHVDKGRSRNGSNGNEPISSEMIVAIGLSFMGGKTCRKGDPPQK